MPRHPPDHTRGSCHLRRNEPGDDPRSIGRDRRAGGRHDRKCEVGVAVVPQRADRAQPDGAPALEPEADEYGLQRAFAALADPRQPGGNPKDLELWDAMDAAAQDVATVLADSKPHETLGKTRDALGSTHHDAGTLRMGDDPASSA